MVKLTALAIGSLLIVVACLSVKNLDALGQECVSYDLKAKMVTITCISSNLSKISDFLNNTAILKKEPNGVWLLNANLKIWHDSTFYINSTETKWLKISSSPENPYRIYILGNLRINSVKITSWNESSNNFAKSDGKIPRASITILPQGTGKTNIVNSEIAYLGDGSTSRGQGLSYWSGDDSVISNNTIHHMYYGFYSEGVGNITIENNHIYNDIKYGIDPHTGTHDMMIRNNTVHNNGHIGIICSLDCKNITIDGNKVFNNTNAGIMLSKNVQDSVVKNNKIDDENVGISVSESSADKVHGNFLVNNVNGIQIKANSSNNNIYDNSIHDSVKCGIEISNNSSRNALVSNIVMNSSRFAICVLDSPFRNIVSNNTLDAANEYAVYARDSNSPDNVFKYNRLLNVLGTPVKLFNSTLTFINNTLDTKLR